MSFDKDRKSKRVLLHYSQNCDLLIYNTYHIEHFDAGHPLTNLAAPVIAAGYAGVSIYECVLRKDERHIHILEMDTATPEGIIFTDLQNNYQCGEPLPTAHQLLNQIVEQYKTIGVKNERS